MIFGKSKLELKVGVFVFTGLVTLTVFVLLIGKLNTWSSGYRVNFLFNFVNGVKIGAPVRFSGVDVGEVKEIKFSLSTQENKPAVKINCWVRKDVNIPSDSTVWVNTLGLLGEKYVEIMPGKDYSRLLQQNQEMTGEDPIPMHEVTVLAKNIATNINTSIEKIMRKEGTIGKLLYEDTIYNEIEAAIKNKDGTVGRFFYDDSVYQGVEDLIADLRANPWKLFWKEKEKEPMKTRQQQIQKKEEEKAPEKKTSGPKTNFRGR